MACCSIDLISVRLKPVTECYALFGPGGLDEIVKREFNRHGQHHGIEHRHARQLPDGKRRSRHNPIQQQARQNFTTVLAGPSLDD
jgi:hypothetical protein